MSSRVRQPISFALVFSLALTFEASFSFVDAQDHQRGGAIFQSQCASCHGARGEGNEEHFDRPLHGDLSAIELAKVIQETMPQENPGSLSVEQSLDVASFVHHEFYSNMAQLRNAPPRVELSHLTIDQFRNSIADMMLPIHGPPAPWSGEAGLTRKIAHGDWGKDRAELEQKVDGLLEFDWGDKRPLESIDKEKWQVRWNGSIYAPVTGTYEFYLDSSIRANLYVNRSDTPFIDANVVSFENTLNTATIFLLGGRSYHIAMDVSRSKEPTARVSLQWKIPLGIRESIPGRCLSPTSTPTQLLCHVPFPPDDSSVGYARGRGISKEWDEATTAAAIQVGNELIAHLKQWMPPNDNNPGDAEAVKRWCHRWVGSAFRHRLTESEQQRYVNRFFENEPSMERAVKKVTFLALKSPNFQYPSIAASIDEAIVANLALAMWDSLPDEWMLELAAKRECHTEEQIAVCIDRMMNAPDMRLKNKLRHFFHEFLGIRHLKDLSKDPSKYPEFNDRLAADLKVSLDLFLDEFVNDPNRDLRALLTADYLYLNGRLAAFYGIALPPDAPFQKVTVPRDQRSGVLSHPYLLSGLSYHASSSPIHRGVFLARRVLGRSLRPPVDAIIPLSEAAAPDLTTRERVTVQTSGAMCQTCHRVINPLGFTLEHFDAVGRYRNEELGKAIDARGVYTTSQGDEVEVQGVREVAEFLSNSKEVHESMIRQLFQHLTKQPIAAFGVDRITDLKTEFEAQGFALKPLVKRLMLVSSLQFLHPNPTL